jgi:hypothetical protein
MIRIDAKCALFTLIISMGLTSLALAQPSLRRILKIKGEGYWDYLGYTLVSLGDINGDGLTDLGISDLDDGRAPDPQFILRVYFGGRGVLMRSRN